MGGRQSKCHRRMDQEFIKKINKRTKEEKHSTNQQSNHDPIPIDPSTFDEVTVIINEV